MEIRTREGNGIIATMEHTAILKTESRDANSVSGALDVDNIKLKGLSICTKVEKGRIVTKIRSREVNTLLNTLDDIIHCQMVAEKVIAGEGSKNRIKFKL